MASNVLPVVVRLGRNTTPVRESSARRLWRRLFVISSASRRDRLNVHLGYLPGL